MVAYILTAVPFIWMIAALPFVNRVHPYVLGVPFLVFWIQLGVVVSVLCIHTLYWMERKKEREANQKEAGK